MEFCPKCGGMIIVNGEKAACAKCSYKLKKKPKLQIVEKIEANKEIPVINEQESEVKPIVEMTCPKCKNKKAYFWTIQTRSADESETKFYKCTKCNYTWRIYR